MDQTAAQHSQTIVQIILQAQQEETLSSARHNTNTAAHRFSVMVAAILYAHLHNAAFTFGLDNFTVEFWLRLDASFSFAAATYLLTFGTGNYLGILSSTFRWRSSGGTNFITGTLTPVVETWYHVALVRSGGGTKLFIDGTQDGSTYVAGTDFTNNQITFGASGTGTNSLFGCMDDVRVTKGVARYTANFTPPATPFPNA